MTEAQRLALVAISRRIQELTAVRESWMQNARASIDHVGFATFVEAKYLPDCGVRTGFQCLFGIQPTDAEKMRNRRAVAGLVRDGFLLKVDDRDGNPARNVKLTEQGREYLEQMTEAKA